MAPTTHIIKHVTPVQAPSQGGLPGFAATCTCGSVISASLKEIMWSWANDHVRYYTAKESKK